MARIAPFIFLFLISMVGCYERRQAPPPDDGKVKVKVQAPGVNVDIEGKKTS
jgi:hypothetical protein